MWRRRWQAARTENKSKSIQMKQQQEAKQVAEAI